MGPLILNEVYPTIRRTLRVGFEGVTNRRLRRGAGAESWTPADLGSKLVAWYDFTQLTGADGTAFGSVSPRAGTFTQAITSSGASRPTLANGGIVTGCAQNGLAFTTTQFLDSAAAISITTPFTVAMGCDPTINVAGGADRYTMYFDTPVATASPRLGLGTLSNSAGSTKNWFLCNGAGGLFIDYTINANWATWSTRQYIVANYINGATGGIRYNGTAIKTGASTAVAAWTHMRFGANLNGTDGLNGYVFDIVIASNLTAAELAALERWFSTRYTNPVVEG